MKKLLSILASVGLVATASTTVVSCGTSVSNNPNYAYKDFEGWVNESKDKNVDEIIFVGGRQDVDTLSFLAARQQAVTNDANFQDITKLTDSSLSQDADKKFSEWVNNNDSNAQGINSVISTSNQGLTIDDQKSEGSIVVSHAWGKWSSATGDSSSKNPTMALHSILVDKVEDFFKNGIGKDIIDKFVKNQAKSFNALAHDEINSKPYNNKHMKQKEKDKQINDVTKNIKNKLTGEKGPFFLIISAGTLVGIQTGYKNYKQFDSSLKKDTSGNYELSKAQNDLVDLFRYFGSNVWQATSLYNWLDKNWMPGSSADSIVGSNVKIDKDGWDSTHVGTGKTYDPKAAKDDNSSNTTNAYAIDPAKYID